MALTQRIIELQEKYGFKTIKPLSENTVHSHITRYGLNNDFLEFYTQTNGLVYEWFRLLPLEDSSNIKHTWDSLEKENDPNKSKFEVDEEFLGRFVIFAEIGGGECAVFDKLDGSIWYEQDGELYKTDLDLISFIETCLKEVAEL